MRRNEEDGGQRYKVWGFCWPIWEKWAVVGWVEETRLMEALVEGILQMPTAYKVKVIDRRREINDVSRVIIVRRNQHVGDV